MTRRTRAASREEAEEEEEVLPADDYRGNDYKDDDNIVGGVHPSRFHWTYRSEGGKHAIFERKFRASRRCYCSCRNKNKSRHLLLRIRKLDLALSSSTFSVGCVGKERLKKISCHGDDSRTDRGTLSDVVWGERKGGICCGGGLLHHHYLDEPRPVTLSWPFLSGLRSQALASGRIPSSRLPDWTTTTADDPHENEVRRGQSTTTASRPPPVGQLVPDYRFLILPPPTSCLSEAAIGLFDRGSSSSFSPSPSSSCCVCASVVVALEIKPKAGHVACSPLVRRCHRIKYRLSRFAILQQLWVQGCVQKGWDFSAKQEVKAKVKDDNHNNHDSGGSGTMGATRSTSQYDPGDLLSSDRDRIERAIEGLLKTPQNNCRLSMDGNEVLLELGSVDPSSKKTTPTPGAAAAEAVEADWRNDVDRALLGLSSADRLQKANKGDPMMLLVRVCAEILFREPLLNQLAALQRLDLVLDADGAIAVHRRLVHDLCDGSIEKAEALVDNGGIRGWDWGDTASGPSPASHPLLDASPFAPPPTDPSRILQLCDLARQTKECLQEEKDGGDRDDHASLAAGSHLDDARRSDRLRELHEMALGVVEQLNSDDCVYLLRNWLLALAASDLSFFITLMRINDDGNDNDDDSDALAHNTSLDVTVTSLQSKNGLGTVEILWSDCGSDRRGVAMRQHRRRTVIRYQIKVIDFELKPARKLRDRHAKESPFSNMAM